MKLTGENGGSAKSLGDRGRYDSGPAGAERSRVTQVDITSSNLIIVEINH